LALAIGDVLSLATPAHRQMQSSTVMKYLSLAAVAILLTIAPCRAFSQSSLFRAAYACSERGPSSVCVYGTIPKGKQITVLAKGWKSSALKKEEFSNKGDDFQNGVETSTRLQVTTPPPKDTAMIAVLAGAQTVNELPLEEIKDEAIAGRIAQHIKTTNELNLNPDIRVLKTRLLRVSPTILLSETFLAVPDDVAALEKELPTGCFDCQNVPLLIGQTLEDLFKEIRPSNVNVEQTCGGIDLAFTLSGRPYILSHALTCESDSFSATLVHDLSEERPKLVFKMTGGL
jgi:hypothetical protein